MVDRPINLSTRFGMNQFDDFSENAFYGRTTKDARATAIALLTLSSRTKTSKALPEL